MVDWSTSHDRSSLNKGIELMARTGRKPKQGKRNRSGRLKRTPNPHDKGNGRVAAMRARYGEHYCWALGRAYAKGLLGAGSLGKARLDAAKGFVRAYRRFIGGDVYRCPLDDTPRGGNVETLDTPRDAAQQAWLFLAMDSMEHTGGRPYLDQLMSTAHTDTGPNWLENLLNGKQDSRDTIVLEAALEALDAITPDVRTGIVWERY